jgi:NAD+ kinase
MENKNPSFSHIAIIYNTAVEPAQREAEKIAEFIKARKIKSLIVALDEWQTDDSKIPPDVDLFITLGGDGTVLRTGHLCAPRGIPLLAINLGSFGFLIEVSRTGWREKISQLLKGDYWVERRMMMEVSLYQNDVLTQTSHCLNEAVIGRGRIVRPVHLEVSLDGKKIATYVADGMIVATPTGSTAYSLAAGGPVLPPELRNILLQPVAPHLSVDRAIILAEETKVSVKVYSDHEAVMSIDGYNPISLTQNDRVDIGCSKFSLKFIRFQENGYFYRNLMMLMDQNPASGERE